MLSSHGIAQFHYPWLEQSTCIDHYSLWLPVRGEKSSSNRTIIHLKYALALVTHRINSNFLRCICIRNLTMLIHITHTIDDYSIYMNNWWKRYICYYFQRNDFKIVNTTKQLNNYISKNIVIWSFSWCLELNKLGC